MGRFKFGQRIKRINPGEYDWKTAIVFSQDEDTVAVFYGAWYQEFGDLEDHPSAIHGWALADVDIRDIEDADSKEDPDMVWMLNCLGRVPDWYYFRDWSDWDTDDTRSDASVGTRELAAFLNLQSHLYGNRKK